MFEIDGEALEENNEKRNSIYRAVGEYYQNTLKEVHTFILMNRSFFTV